MNPTALVLLALTSTAAQLPPSPDPTPVPIRGAVVDDAGRPVAGADVWLADALPPEEGRRFGLELWWSSLTGPGEGTPPVLVHARAGADGGFQLELPAEAAARRSPPPLAVWAASGRGRQARVALRRLPRVVLADDPPVRIALAQPTRAELTILTPQREPAVGTRVRPTRVGEVPIPEPLGRSLVEVADARGRAIIGGFAPSALGQVRVEAEGFGEQSLDLPDSARDDPGGEPIALVLAPVGRIRGQLVMPRDEPVRGASVRATSQVGGHAGSGQAASARVACDERGRFEIPAIAAGMASLDIGFDPAKDSPLRAQAAPRLVVRAGQTAEVAIAMRETVIVRGLFREKGTNRPIAGVKVALNGRTGGDRFAVTDPAGRFAGRILRDVTQPFGWPIRDPLPFFEPNDFPEPRQRMPRPGVFELELPPAELRRGVDVRGTVAGEDGRPIAGALVEASWHDSRGIDQSAPARTDRAGGFVLRGISPLAELDVTAWDRFAATATTVRAATAAEHPIALTLGPGHAVSIGGRVVDPGGRPVPGAAVRLRRQARGKDGRGILDKPVADANGAFVLRTGADGRFRAHGRFPARSDYVVEASAPGRLAVRSAPVAATALADRPPILVLRRVRAVEGRIVDRDGRPVAGAAVRQSGDGPMPTEAATDDDGRFHLPGVIEGPALILAEKAGFRPSLQAVDDESKPVEVVLASRDEPPTAMYHTLPPTLPVDEEKALAHRLIEPLAATVLARGDDTARFRFLTDAAEIDPQAALEWLDEVKLGNANLANSVRLSLAQALAREGLDEATMILEACGAETRARGYARLARDAPDVDAARKRTLLDQALLNARAANTPGSRLYLLGEIADRLIDLGDVDRARAILKEARELVGKIPRDDKGNRLSPLHIVVPLARLDLPAALGLIEDVERADQKDEPGDRSRIYERSYSSIADRLADRSPAVAEEVLERMAIRPSSDSTIVRVCTRMAARDPDRARRIAATRFSPDAGGLRWYTLGLMAQAVAATDRAAAVRLLHEAFDELGRLAALPPRRGDDPAMLAAALWPAVERIEPDRLAECLGRALLMRRSRGDQIGLGENGVGYSAAPLAMLTARYDRDLAARLLQPELDRLGSHQANFGTDYISPRVLAALALIDPRQAVAMVEAFPDDPAPGTDPDATKVQARRFVARVLALHGDDRWRMIARDFLYFWTPDQREP